MPTYVAAERTKATHPLQTVLSASGKMGRVREAHYGKESATAGVVERVYLQRCNSGGVTGANITEKRLTRSPTNQLLGQTWGTAPAFVGNPLVIVDDGDKPSHKNRWRPVSPADEIWLVDADEVGLDATSGTNTSTDSSMSWAEDVPGLENRDVRRRPRKRGFWSYNCHMQHISGGVTTKPFRSSDTNVYFIVPHPRFLHRHQNTLIPTGGGGPNIVALAASIAGVGSITPNLRLVRAFATTVAGTSQISADVRVTRRLATVVAGTSSVTADLVTGGLKALAAAVAGSSTISAALRITERLQTAIAGSSTVTAAIRITRRLQTTVAGTSVITAAITATKRLATAVAGASQIFPNLTIIGSAPVQIITQALLRRRRLLRQAGGIISRKRRNW